MRPSPPSRSPHLDPSVPEQDKRYPALPTSLSPRRATHRRSRSVLDFRVCAGLLSNAVFLACAVVVGREESAAISFAHPCSRTVTLTIPLWLERIPREQWGIFSARAFAYVLDSSSPALCLAYISMCSPSLILFSEPYFEVNPFLWLCEFFYNRIRRPTKPTGLPRSFFPPCVLRTRLSSTVRLPIDPGFP